MSEGQSVKVKNQSLTCKHCESGQFVHRTAQLNTAFLEFLDLGWLNKSADIYICASCGFLHWFLEPQVDVSAPGDQPAFEPQVDEPIPLEDPAPSDDLTEPTECLACGQRIPAGAAKCPSCGWSYTQ